MDTMRKILRDLVDDIPEEKIGKAVEALEDLAEEDRTEAWSIWEELGKDATEGKWEDTSERHDFYLYGMDR